jgi:phage shock protein A
MSVLKRIFKIGQAEAHNLINQLEDPIKLTEQGIRDLKKDLDESFIALAEVKAIEIRTRTSISQHEVFAKEYENKAMLLLKKAQDGTLSAEEADRLATEALAKKDENFNSYQKEKNNLKKLETSILQLNKNVGKLKNDISKWENELKTLKARVKVSSTATKINKQLAEIDGLGTVSMLEKMQDKVAQEEALADSYGEMATETKTLDDEIDRVLREENKSTSLDALKKKMGI